MKIKAVLFDMDGVLVNSEKLMAKSSVLMFKERGVEVGAEDFLPFIGAGERAYLGGVARLHGLEYDDAMTSEAYGIYTRLATQTDISYPDSVSTVKTLRASGIKCAVCTSAEREKLFVNLDSLGLRDGFDALISGGDISHNKPSPEIYLKGAAALGLLPEECVVVEDAKNGILAAKAAGMYNVALTTSFSEDELKATVSPDFIRESVSGVISVVSELNGINII